MNIEEQWLKLLLEWEEEETSSQVQEFTTSVVKALKRTASLPHYNPDTFSAYIVGMVSAFKYVREYGMPEDVPEWANKWPNEQ